MEFQLTHPALRQLIRQRGVAKLKRMKANLFCTRRWILTVVAVTLAAVWLSQILLSVFLRSPADPALLAKRIAFGLLGFTLWQILKVIFRKPVEPFEWTPSERQLLIAGPIERHHLVGYRLLTICYSVILKAACFVVVMIPDMRLIAAGFIGMTLGLAFCEFLKTTVELLVYGLSKSKHVFVRALTALVVGAALAAALTTVLCRADAQALLASPAAWQFLVAVAIALGDLTQAGVGVAVVWPFDLFSNVILASEVNFTFIMRIAGASLVTVSMFAAVRWADHWMNRSRLIHEQNQLKKLAGASGETQKTKSTKTRRVSVPRRINGIGSIAWRQCLGAWHYRSSITFSFLIPIVLCCIPMISGGDSDGMPLFLVGSVAFYSYLLLPAALMLDFRRDVDRLAVLKALPIEPRNIVIGQLLVPVTLCSLFQGIVFFIGTLLGQASPLWFGVCWLAFIPMNLLIMSFENLIFMLHPYRKNKEGIDVFLRTILTFTGKGLTWGAAVALVVTWALLSKYIASDIGPLIGVSTQLFHGVLFVGGAMALVLSASAVLVQCLTKLFERFDPGTDAVSMG